MYGKFTQKLENSNRLKKELKETYHKDHFFNSQYWHWYDIVNVEAKKRLINKDLVTYSKIKIVKIVYIFILSTKNLIKLSKVLKNHYFLHTSTVYCLSFNILFYYKYPLNDTFGYIHESFPIILPGLSMTLQPICVLSPIIAPNFLNYVSIICYFPLYSYINVTLTFRPSSLKFDTFPPAATCTSEPKIESPI